MEVLESVTSHRQPLSESPHSSHWVITGATLRIHALLGPLGGIRRFALHRLTSDCELWQLSIRNPATGKGCGPYARAHDRG